MVDVTLRRNLQPTNRWSGQSDTYQVLAVVRITIRGRDASSQGPQDRGDEEAVAYCLSHSSGLLPAHSTTRNIRWAARVADLDMSTARRNHVEIAMIIRMFVAITIPQFFDSHALHTSNDAKYCRNGVNKSLLSGARSQTARRREEGSAGNARHCLHCLSSTRTISTRWITDDSSHSSHPAIAASNGYDSKGERHGIRSMYRYFFSKIFEYIFLALKCSAET